MIPIPLELFVGIILGSVKIDFDVDIDMANRDDFLKLVNVTPASIEKDGKFTKHNTGVYFQNIPKFPLEGYSTIDHKQAEEEGLDKVFIASGFEWREPGCSMCLAMNADKLTEGERCASTSNRNFEGRQGRGGRTHLVSPQMAVAAALAGHLVDVRGI